MEKLVIEKLNHQGQGVAHIKGKIVFIPNTLPNEDVNIEIIEDKRKYSEGKVLKIMKPSSQRIQPACPYFNNCGGCNLMHLNYEDGLDFKLNKVKEIVDKYGNIKNVSIEVRPNSKPLFYRNKISLKIKNKEVGYYHRKSHEFIPIKKCIIAKLCLNDLLKQLNIKNGKITIRSNHNDELLLIIDSDDKNIPTINDSKVKGIILNDKLIYGEDKFIEKIDDLIFQVSYDSFFQVNNETTKEMINIVRKHIIPKSNVLDLYCGVGLFSIAISSKVNKIYGIEIVTSAIKNALVNSKLNKTNNIEFILGDTSKLKNILDPLTSAIVDPPRSGLNKETLNALISLNLKQIIYVSCDPMSLARDLKILLQNYKIKKFYILDAFSYTYHVENIVILEKKK